MPFAHVVGAQTGHHARKLGDRFFFQVKKECAGFVQYATDIRDIFAVLVVF